MCVKVCEIVEDLVLYPREKCNVLDVFMRCVLEVFERVLAIYSTVLKVFYTFLECLELGPGINVTRNT